MYNITNATFITSVFDVNKLPKEKEPEVAFVGRSNVGKSSLINAIVGIKRTAKTSSTPGRTQSLNYFQIEFFDTDDKTTRFNRNIVDLPGYGYAKVGAQQQNKFAGQIEYYIQHRKQLSGIFLLLDIKREPEQEEILISEMFANSEKNFLLILTKADRLTNSELIKAKKNLKDKLNLTDEQILLVSTVGNRKMLGIDKARDILCSWLK